MVSSEAVTENRRGAGRAGVVIAFIPWILFGFASDHWSLKLASLVALVAAVAIAGRCAMTDSPKLLALGAAATFAVFAAVAFLAEPSVVTWVGRYVRALAAAALAIVAWISVITVPFTEEYARAQVPREYWHSAQFRQINRKLTILWALVFTAMVPIHIVAGIINAPLADIVLNWVIPIAMIVRAAKKTSEIADQAQR